MARLVSPRSSSSDRRPGGRQNGAGRSRRGSLVIVGTGIKLVAHTTLEALNSIQRAGKVLYLVTEPATETWIRQLNPTAETLAHHYAEGKLRYDTYRAMTDQIMTAVRSGMDVCAAFYGHPGVFVNASHEAIRLARREGFPARMLPGVSTEDCLIADLGVDPGQSGSQNFEATDFLIRRRRFDPTSSLILWQVGVLGETSVRKGMACRPERLRVLTAALRRHYPRRHPLVLYEAAQYPVCEPAIKRIPLEALPRQTILAMTTLYVAPRRSRPGDPEIAGWLGRT
jgi:uncharacterized protein YabN with tetrapyrrole methylase and pyrophosphatase domain